MKISQMHFCKYNEILKRKVGVTLEVLWYEMNKARQKSDKDGWTQAVNWQKPDIV